MDSKPANCDVRGATLNKQAFRAFQRLPFQKDLAVACNALTCFRPSLPEDTAPC